MSPLEPTPRAASAEELRALAAHAEGRAALYRRKVLLGRGEPRRLAELERIAAGATRRAAQAGVSAAEAGPVPAAGVRGDRPDPEHIPTPRGIDR